MLNAEVCLCSYFPLKKENRLFHIVHAQFCLVAEEIVFLSEKHAEQICSGIKRLHTHKMTFQFLMGSSQVCVKGQNVS